MSNKKETLSVEVKKKTSFFKSIIIILLALLATAGVIIFFAVKDNNYGKFSSEPSNAIMVDAAIAVATGTQLTVNENDLNDYMLYLMQDKQQDNTNLDLETVYFDVNGAEQPIKVYIPFTYYGIHFGFSCDFNVSYNNESNRINAKVSNSKIGMVPIPSSWVENKLCELFPEYISKGDSNIYINSNIKFKFDGQDIELKISNVQISNDDIIIQISGGLSAVGSYISGKLGI